MKYNNHNVIIYLIIFVIMNGVKAQGMKKKILCLHGGGSSGPAFQSQTGMKNLMASLDSNKYEFVFANTPENNGVWIKDPPGGKEGIATNSSDDKESEKDTGGVCSTKKDKATCNAESGCTWYDEYNMCWTETKRRRLSTDSLWAQMSMNYLDSIIATQGPFYAILGYSQGAAMSIVYVAENQHTFEKMLLFNGYLPTTHQGLMDKINTNSPIKTPTLIFIGEKDVFATMGLEVKNKFSNYIEVISSQANHHLPYTNDPTFQNITNFIEYFNTAEIPNYESSGSGPAGSGPEGARSYCSIHGLSDLYSQTLPSGESCPKGCECCKADGSCGECFGDHICEGNEEGFKTCTPCKDKFFGNQSAIDMCLVGAGPGFMAADGMKYDNSCGGDAPREESGASGPGETDPWTTCLQNNPEIYPSCPTPGDPPNGTDLGEKFYSDIEYAKSVLRDWPGFSPHLKCLCESKCGQYLKEVWPGNANDRLCNLYLSDGKKCTGGGCCGAIAKFRSLYTWRFDISNLGIRHKWFTEGSEFDKVAETIQNQSAPLIRLSCGKHILLLYRLEVKLTGRNKKKIYYSIYFQRKVH